MNKYLMLLLSSLLSFSALSADPCLRYMVNTKNAEIIFKKNCNLIIRDSGKNEVASIDACFTKIKKQFPGKISWGFVAELQRQSGSFRDGKIIINTTKAYESLSKVDLDITTASPELLTRYRYRLIYNKKNDTLVVVKDQGLFQLNNKYNLLLQCR